MSELITLLKMQIAAHGPMDVGQFMAQALGHPKNGYYMKKDPFGADGDFTTAPEISQMFGEVIGAWAADVWAQLGRPAKFILLECGPGRGTLMADMMRATQSVEGFHQACQIRLLEMSPVLKEAQAKALKDYKPRWHTSLDNLSIDCPVIAIANEFLDALPIRQMENTSHGWIERLISYSAEKGFHFTGGTGEIFESAPAREEFVHLLCGRIKAHSGAALFIDYGHVKSAPGDTLQAVYRHEFVSVFENIGDADITSHVDFEAVARHAGIDVYGPVEQGAFLKAIGIEKRAQYLEGRPKAKKDEIEKALHRLTHSDQMGSLFKAICFSHGNIRPAGF